MPDGRDADTSASPPTIVGLLRRATDRLTAAGLATPRLDAEVLLRHLLGIDRTSIFLRYHDPAPDGAAAGLDALIDRRLAGEPVAYLVGEREFLGLPFRVTPDVLVPRPETELLVEWAIAWLGADGRETATVVDVGTGSGAIAIGLAHLAAAGWDGTVLAIDVSAAALAIAASNATRLAVETGDARLARIQFRRSDLLGAVTEPLDLVLANLPYLAPGQVDGNAELAAEPRLALVGGADGLDLVRRLIDDTPRLLTEDGAMALELDPSQADAVASLLREREPAARVTIHRDLAGRERFVTLERVRAARRR